MVACHSRSKCCAPCGEKKWWCDGDHGEIALVVDEHNQVAIKNKRNFDKARYYCWYPNKMRGKHRKRAQEKIANDSALVTEPERLAKVSAAIEIIEHRAPRAAPCHWVTPASGIHRSSRCDKSNLKFCHYSKLRGCRQELSRNIH